MQKSNNDHITTNETFYFDNKSIYTVLFTVKAVGNSSCICFTDKSLFSSSPSINADIS